MDGMHAVGIGLVFAVAGGVKGITGMGLPTVAMSLLGLWMAPLQAMALMAGPSLLTNAAQCIGPHWRGLAARLWPAWLALVVATLAAPSLVATASPAVAHRLLGAVLVAYGLWGLWRPVVSMPPPRASRAQALAAAGIGALTGVVSATTAVFVLPLVPYLQALKLEKEALVQALGLSFSIATLALIARLQAFDAAALLSPEAALALAAALAGLRLGRRVRDRLAGASFQRLLFLAFVGLGAANLAGSS